MTEEIRISRSGKGVARSPGFILLEPWQLHARPVPLHPDGQAVPQSHLSTPPGVGSLKNPEDEHARVYSSGQTSRCLSPLGSTFFRTLTWWCLTLFWPPLKFRGPAQVAVPTPCADEVLCRLSVLLQMSAPQLRHQLQSPGVTAIQWSLSAGSWGPFTNPSP